MLKFVSNVRNTVLIRSLYTKNRLKKIPLDQSIVEEILSFGPVKQKKVFVKEDEDDEELSTKQRKIKKEKVSLDTQCEEHVNWIFQENRMRRIASALTPEELPKDTPEFPEVAFAGRSNVGKSSLINSILHRHNLVVSNRPGETQSLGFYRIGKFLTLVDLPGYGFAYAKEEKIMQWTDLMKLYLRERKNLKMVYVLIDPRHGLKGNDFTMIDYLEENKRNFQIVLTKTDLMFVDELARVVYDMKQDLSKYKYVTPNLMYVSSKSKSGIAMLKTDLVKYSTFDLDYWRRNVKKNVTYFI